MPKFSENSLKQLKTCHPNLQRLFNEVIEHYDCAVTEGYRDKEAQEAAFAAGKSQKHFPNGNHNKYPSMAVDVYPYPINMQDREKFYHFAGFVQGVAASMGIKIRWGGDWNSDNNLHNQGFYDLPHFELV